MSDTIHIFGGGIAGLSCAHALLLSGCQVHLYEKQGRVGGVASSDIQDGAPVERSWRGFGPCYYNLFRVLSEIPSARSPFHSILDRDLTPLHWSLIHDQGSKNNDLSHLFRLSNKVRLSNIILKAFSETESHATTFSTRVSAMFSQQEAKDLISLSGPWIGVNPSRLSWYTAAGFYYSNAIPGRLRPWLTLNGPTHQFLFKPWVRFLSQHRFTLHLNVGVEHMVHQSSSKARFTLTNGATVASDYCVVALGPYDALKVCPGLIDPRLCQEQPHIQIGFMIVMSRPLPHSLRHIGMVFADSEYNITIASTYATDYEPSKKRGFLLGTACVADVSGKITKQPMSLVTRRGFVAEILGQMLRCKEFQLKFGCHVWPYFESFHIWKGWHFPGDHNYVPDPITRSNIVWCDIPKWVVSTRSSRFMPIIRTKFSNVLLAGAHVQTSLPDMYSMEAACESGIRAANCILRKLHLPLYPLKVQKLPSGFEVALVAPLINLATWLEKLKL